MESQLTNEKAKSSGIGLIAALMAGYSMVYMDKSMISTAILPISQDFSLNAAQTGLIMSFFFLGYSLMQIPGGWLADKIGAKKVLMASLAIIALFSFAFGAVSSLMLFIAVRFCAGIGHGGYPPSVTKAVAEHFPKEKRTFIQALTLSTSGIGGILAFTLGANLISMNWRYGYVALGTLFAVAFVLVGLFVPKDTPKVAVEAGQPKLSFKDVIVNRNVQVLFVALLLLNILLYGNMSWLPTFLQNNFGLEITTIGYLLSANAVFQTVATIFAGALLSKLFLGKERGFILVSCLVAAALVFVFLSSTNLVLSMIVLFAISMISVGAFTAILTFPHKLMDPQVIGSSMGIINTGGTLGGFLAPMILGQLITINNGSFTLAFSFMAVASILCGVIALGVKKEV